MTDQSADVVARRVELAMQMMELGAWVFPLKSGGKLPLLPKRHGGNGFLDANGDQDMARTFLNNPGQPNYGIAFPQGSDVIILDLDGGGDPPRPTWKADWQALYERLGPPGLTYIVRTPSGGRHAYYRWRSDLYGPMPPGDEFLGWTVRKPWKGYAVGPGSVVDGLAYEPVGLPTIADLPEPWARADLEERAAAVNEPFIRVGGSKGPGQVQKGGRHRFLRDRARHLVGLGVSGEALFVAISDLNRQLAEPKTDEEVRRAIGDAESKFEPDEVDPETGETMVPNRDRSLGRKKSGPPQVLDVPFYSAVAIANMTPEIIDWAWRDYLAFGTVVELVGPPKAGKTTLVFNLLRSFVEAQPFLDRPTAGGSAVVLTEQGPTSLRAVIARAGLEHMVDVQFLLHRDTRTASWPDIVETAVQWCHSIGARLLVVDTLPVFAGLSGESENNAGDALEAMEPLVAAASEGLAILVNRHRRKGGAPDIADEARGSGAFSGSVDVILSLRRREGGSRPTIRVLAAASRFDEAPEELYVELVEGRYVVIGDDAAIEAAEAREAVLAVVSAQTPGVNEQKAFTVTELVDATSKSRATVQRVVLDLVRTGDLARTGSGKRGDPHRFLPTDDPGLVSAQTPTPYGGEVNGGSGREASPAPTVECHFPHDHSTAWTRAGEGWFCAICHPEANVA